MTIYAFLVKDAKTGDELCMQYLRPEFVDMARDVRVYCLLWKPDAPYKKGEKIGDRMDELIAALCLLILNKKRYIEMVGGKKHRWWYHEFIRVLARIIKAGRENPDAIIETEDLGTYHFRKRKEDLCEVYDKDFDEDFSEDYEVTKYEKTIVPGDYVLEKTWLERKK